jgi:signal transduction histidine kinase
MSKFSINRLWFQLSLAFGAVILIASIIVPIVFFLMRPDFAPREIPPDAGQRFVLLRIQGMLVFLAVGSVVGIIAGTWVSWRLTAPLEKLAQGTHAIGARDLTYRIPLQGSQEIKLVAQSFNEMAATLQAAETQRQNLLADVAHELRTPLTVLQGNLRAILDDVYTLDKGEVARLYDQTRHLISLVNDLHELAQAEARRLPLQLQRTDLNELVQAAADILEPVAEVGGVTLQVATPDVPTVVMADKARLMQVLQNLLTNALRHTPQTGQIWIAISTADREAVISVRDSGDGIAAEHLPYIFDRFYRTDHARDRDRGGAGLGLAIVRAMVEAHNGYTEVASTGLSQGSTFSIHLPLKTDKLN